MMKTKFRLLLISILLPLFLMLNACGGSSDGGMTGTGITAGRITNFGSVFVNGIQFNVDNATFSRDGVISQQSDFLVGEYVVIEGNVNPSGTSGTATKVIFTDLLEGEVTGVSTDEISIEVLGQNIKTDSLSIFHDFTNLTDLAVGSVVEVSGLRDASGVLVANSIELKQTVFIQGTSENEVKGMISNVNQAQMTFQIGAITIDYSNAEVDDFASGIPIAGQFVEAISNQPLNGNILIAFEVELEDEFLTVANNTEVEIEGLVTRFSSATDFDVNGINITTNNSTEFDDGVAGNLALNVLLEVEGIVNSSGVLVADKIKFRGSSGSSDDDNDDDSSDTDSNDENVSDNNSEVRIEDSIQSINISSSEVVVAGTTIVIDATTLMRDKSDQEVSALTINDLAVGDNVEVRGFTLANGKVLATRFERDN